MNRFSLIIIATAVTFIIESEATGQAVNDVSYEMLLVRQDYPTMYRKSEALADTADYYFHSYALDKLGEISGSIETLEKGLEIYPDNKSFELALANLYFRTGQYANAKPYLLKHQSRGEIFIKLVKVLEFESDYLAAIIHLEKRLETDSLNVEYMIRLGDNYEAMDMFLSARDIYSRTLEYNPHDIVTMSKLANIYLKTEDYRSAINLCDRALVLDSTNRTIMKIQGLAAFRKGEFDLAEDNFSQLLAMGDSSLVILKHLGISESKGYNFAGSREHLHMAYALDTADYEISFFLGRGYLNSTEPKTGIAYLNQADSLLQPSPAIRAAIYMEKASGYYSMKEYIKALESYETAYKIRPRPDYLFYMGSLYRYQLDNPKMALIHYQKFIDEIDKNNEGNDGVNVTKQQGIKIRKAAEEEIVALKEMLFFEGELDHPVTDTTN